MNYERDLVKSIDDLTVEGGNVEANKKFEEIKRVLKDGHGWIMNRLELYIKQSVSDTIWQKTVERSRIEVMLYNFSEGEVPESLMKIFKNGMDSVPSLRMRKKDIDDRVEEALLEYMT